MADPDLQMGGGGGHPDPEIRGEGPFQDLKILKCSKKSIERFKNYSLICYS